MTANGDAGVARRPGLTGLVAPGAVDALFPSDVRPPLELVATAVRATVATGPLLSLVPPGAPPEPVPGPRPPAAPLPERTTA